MRMAGNGKMYGTERYYCYKTSEKTKQKKSTESGSVLGTGEYYLKKDPLHGRKPSHMVCENRMKLIKNG